MAIVLVRGVMMRACGELFLVDFALMMLMTRMAMATGTECEKAFCRLVGSIVGVEREFSERQRMLFPRMGTRSGIVGACQVDLPWKRGIVID